MVCPVSGSVATLKVGSSWASFAIAVPSFLLIGLGLRLDRELDHGDREVDRFEHDRILLIADRVAGRDGLQTHGGGDIAGHDLLDFLALVGVHAQQPPDALLAPLGDVENRLSRPQLARIDAEKRELADKRVGHDLEHQRRERLAVGRMALDDLLPVVDIVALDGGNVERRRKIVHHRIEHGLDTLILEGRPADDGEDLHRDGRLADAALDLGVGRRLAFGELGEQLVVEFGDRLDHLLAIFFAFSSRSAGISSVLYSAPMVSSSHTSAFISTRSMTPLNWSSAPMGS